ncbi:caspase-3-like [Ptychodera flava]|uniref:caspase-3-like n=1 Tax=Ptychodera flava TaxID=63121 RepID=UPI003969C7FB
MSQAATLATITPPTSMRRRCSSTGDSHSVPGYQGCQVNNSRVYFGVNYTGGTVTKASSTPSRVHDELDGQPSVSGRCRRPRVVTAAQSFRTETKEPEVERYETTSKPHGLVVIVAIENFNRDKDCPHSLQLANRPGTQDEVAYLRRAFESLGYIVLVYPDLTAAKLKLKTGLFSDKDHTHYDSFVCCILSRGTRTHIYGSDGVPIKLYELISDFNGRRCPSLGGKPKLFFVESHPAPKANVDVQFAEKVYGEKFNVQFAGYNLNLNCELSGGEQVATVETRPTDVDFLIAACTWKYRGKIPPSDASYVTRLVHAMEKSNGRKDITRALTDASDEFQGEINTIDSRVKFTSTLRKELYLCTDKPTRARSVTFHSKLTRTKSELV